MDHAEPPVRRVLLILAALVLAGCVPVPSTAPTSATGAAAPIATAGILPVGAGPQRTYTVQPQPAPGTCHARTAGAYPLPDPTCTPGATNPQVRQANIRATICARGWTATIRPPLSVTGPEKRANAKSYGGGQNPRTAEYDHLVPLGLGGDPNDPRNLWVEPNDLPGATRVINTKDGVESAARAAVCAGRMPLPQAQVEMAANWVQLGRRLGVIK